MSNTRITTLNGRFWNHPILMSVIQLDEKLASKLNLLFYANELGPNGRYRPMVYRPKARE